MILKMNGGLSYSGLLGAAAFLYLAIHQFDLRRNVDELSGDPKLDGETSPHGLVTNEWH